jgi:hypothetical protein
MAKAPLVDTQVSNYQTVFVENSDDRLVAAEEAKRTGQPFQSTSSNGTDLVPWDIAKKIAEEHAENVGFYVDGEGRTFAAHLEEYHEKIQDPTWVEESNEEKARAHAEYAAEFEAARIKQEEDVRKMMAEGYDPTVAIQQANLERAREHESKSSAYEEQRVARMNAFKSVNDIVQESIEVVNANELGDKDWQERANALSGVVPHVPDANEQAMGEALEIKDRIVAVEVPYKEHAAQADVLLPRDQPGVEIMRAAGSPEELVESTYLAQAAAQNPQHSSDVEEEQQKVAEAYDESDKPQGEALREAEAEVDPRNRAEADEMKENPDITI